MCRESQPKPCVYTKLSMYMPQFRVLELFHRAKNMKNQAEYYRQRANEYELVYQKSERQSDLLKIEKYLEKQFIDKQIIELGCGTGFWTEKLAKKCKSILAIDINKEVIEIALVKSYTRNIVEFAINDLTKLENRESKLEGLFGGFIWSHIKKEEIQDFMKICFSQIKEPCELIFIDNKYVEGSSTPINRVDENGNQYQIRRLKSGKEYEIVKNFPDQKEFAKSINYELEEIEWMELKYYWIVKIEKRKW